MNLLMDSLLHSMKEKGKDILGTLSTSGRGAGILGRLLLTGTGDLYVDLTAVDELLVEELNGLLGLLLGLHFNKSISE